VKRWLQAATAIAITLAACGSNGDPDPGDGGTPAASFGLEQVSLGEKLAQAHGHLRVSLELAEEGDTAAALGHAEHPLAEVLPAVSGELGEHGVDVGAIEEALQAYRDAVQAPAPAEESRTLMEDATAVLDETERTVVGGAYQDEAYRGSVIAALLATAAHEYEESVDGARIALVDEYQDGYGFLQVARERYEGIAGAVESESAEEAEEIEEAFDALASVFPAPQPPPAPAPVEEAEEAAALIGHELEETVGALPLEEADPAEEAEAIEGLLADVLAAYEEGRAEEAAELVAEAYLEHYEVIEPEVIELAPEVNAELEPLLGAELRRRIQEGAPVEEIRSMVDRALELLDQAVAALEQEG
jgi:hypothetical protein